MGTNVFRREGNRWNVSFDGRSVELEARKGVGYIALLLARPGDLLHVADLAGEPPPPDATIHDASSERLRKAVTNRIRDAITRIGALHGGLGEHLRRAIRMGTYCSYSPGRTFEWEL